ncbi:MAG: hypothetical protein WCD69_25015, partial [Xanthobacteraceae bacterium]
HTDESITVRPDSVNRAIEWWPSPLNPLEQALLLSHGVRVDVCFWHKADRVFAFAMSAFGVKADMTRTSSDVRF